MMASEQERNKALVLQLFDEVWNKGNLAFVNEALSADFQDHPPSRSYAVPVGGRESLQAAARNMRNAMPDFHDQMVQCVAENDRVVYLGRMTGTHTGSYLQFQPKGGRITVLGIHYFRIQNGKVAERWSVIDTLGMAQQMGAGSAPAGAH